MICEEQKLKLKIDRFEGLICSYPMYKEGNKSLCWVIEHHAKDSRGGYVVNIGRRREVFFRLEDAIAYFNKGGKNERKMARSSRHQREI